MAVRSIERPFELEYGGQVGFGHGHKTVRVRG